MSVLPFHHVFKQLRLVTVIIGSALFLDSARAITIGDFESISPDSVSIPISQLDNAKYLDVTVDISGQAINYILEQVGADLVLIKIKDELLLKKDALITIKVDSPNGSASRLFSYNSNATQYQITNTQQAKQILKEKQNPEIEGKVLIPASIAEQDTKTEQDEEVKFEDGKLLIDINKSFVNVGIAVYELARANNYNVLVLPGDEQVFNSPLLQSVSSWEDLYLASDKAVKNILFDEYRRLVRVVGNDFIIESDQIELADLDTENPQQPNDQTGALISVRELVSGFAADNNLELLEMPGDGLILDQRVSNQSVTDVNTLAVFASSIQAVVDIDENLGLLRVRKSGE